MMQKNMMEYLVAIIALIALGLSIAAIFKKCKSDKFVGDILSESDCYNTYHTKTKELKDCLDINRTLSTNMDYQYGGTPGHMGLHKQSGAISGSVGDNETCKCVNEFPEDSGDACGENNNNGHNYCNKINKRHKCNKTPTPVGMSCSWKEGDGGGGDTPVQVGNVCNRGNCVTGAVCQMRDINKNNNHPGSAYSNMGICRPNELGSSWKGYCSGQDGECVKTSTGRGKGCCEGYTCDKNDTNGRCIQIS